VKNLSAGPALWVAGAAVGAAALWLGKRRFTQVSASHGELAGSDNDNAGEPEGPESTELPIGRSADPEIDGALSHPMLAIDDTSGASLFGEPEPAPHLQYREPPLDEIWNAVPGLSEGEQTEGYDAVTPEDLGAVWLERATQTTHEHRPHASDPSDIPNIEELAVSESSLSSSLPPDEQEDDDDEIRDDDLDDPFAEHRSHR